MPATNVVQFRPLDAEKPPYPWEPAFARELVYVVVTQPRAWSSVGQHIDPERVPVAGAKALLQAARSLAKECGEGPTDTLAVVQRVRQAMDDGALTRDEASQAATMLEAAEDRGRNQGVSPTTLAVAARTLRDIQRKDLAAEMVSLAAKGQSLSRHADKIVQAEAIGTETSAGSITPGDDVWGAIDRAQRAERLPLGMDAVDDELGGGIKAKTLTVWGAETGVGKTAALVHQGATAWFHGKRVVFVAMEEDAIATMTRIIAWMVGSTITDVERGCPRAKKRLKQVVSFRGAGALAVEYLSSGSTTADLRKAVDRAVKDHPEFKGGWDLLVVDYADKLKPRQTFVNKSEALGAVYTDLRSMAEENSGWVVTGSQLKDLQGKKKPEVQDLAWSRFKGDLADAVLLIWRSPDEPDERMITIGKHRGPGAGVTIGPLHTELERARFVPVPEIDKL